MDEFLKSASATYTVAYFAIVIVISLLEWVRPRREAGDTLRVRWWGNISIGVLDTIAIRSVFPMFGIAWAAHCAAQGWGLFHRVHVPWLLAFVVGVAILDLTAYLQHRLLHQFDFLWRLHRTHHSDHEFDFTTGVRFHPLEALYTTSFMLAAIFLIGAPVSAVLVAEFLSMALTFFDHANVRLPPTFDHALRWIVVTPDMHRIHHSIRADENRRNFGNIVTWWDRLFGTYLHQPALGQDGLTVGLPELMERKHLTLRWMLVQPLLPLAPSDATTASPAVSATSFP